MHSTSVWTSILNFLYSYLQFLRTYAVFYVHVLLCMGPTCDACRRSLMLFILQVVATNETAKKKLGVETGNEAGTFPPVCS